MVAMGEYSPPTAADYAFGAAQSAQASVDSLRAEVKALKTYIESLLVCEWCGVLVEPSNKYELHAHAVRS